MTIWQNNRSGLLTERHRALPHRMHAWHRDATARAIALARWEDDGGFVGVQTGVDRPLFTDGRAVPHSIRDI